MGMYTEIYVSVDLKEDTPEFIMDILKAICYNGHECLLEGYPSRWEYLFKSGSYYTSNTCVAEITFSPISGQYSLIGKGDIKNYEDEIERFFSFIQPYVDTCGVRTFMGYSLYEESVEPVLFYAEGGEI